MRSPENLPLKSPQHVSAPHQKPVSGRNEEMLLERSSFDFDLEPVESFSELLKKTALKPETIEALEKDPPLAASKEGFSAPKGIPDPLLEKALEEVSQAPAEEAPSSTAETVLSEEAAAEAFGEGLVAQAEADFAHDAADLFKEAKEFPESTESPNPLPDPLLEKALEEVSQAPAEEAPSSTAETVLSEEAAAEAFGEGLVAQAEADFAHDAADLFKEAKEFPESTESPNPLPDPLSEKALEEISQAPAEEAPSSTAETVLSEEAAVETFGEGLVAQAEADFAKDEGELFKEKAEAAEKNAETLEQRQQVATQSSVSDENLQALVSVLGEGLQQPQAQRVHFLRQALQQEKFNFLPLLPPFSADGNSLAFRNYGCGTPERSALYSRSLAQISLQVEQLRELRRNGGMILSWCIGILVAAAIFGAIIFSTEHLSQGKAALLSFVICVPVITVMLSILSLGRIWECFTFIQGSGESSGALKESVFHDAGAFLSEGTKGVEEKLLENKKALVKISISLEQAVQRLVLTGCLAGFSAIIWISLAISSPFERFISWEHAGFFAIFCLLLSLATFFVRIGRWENPSTGKNWGWGLALCMIIVTLFGAGAIAAGPIRVDSGEMPEISTSWIHTLSPGGLFENLRGWFYPGIALERVSSN